MKKLLVLFALITSFASYGQTKGVLMNDNGQAYVGTLKNYTAYEAIVSQTGTSAPVISRKDNNWNGVTFTWARSSSGQYTLTTSSPVFIAGKTAVIVSSGSSGLQRINYDVTSTTILTLKTTTMSVVSLILTLTNSDAVLDNTLIEIRVYQ